MTQFEPFLGADIAGAINWFVHWSKLHPILVNFTAALVPVSVAADLAGRLWREDSLRHTAWWTLLCATAITPITAAAGWLFWMPDDNGDPHMAAHKYMGLVLAGLLFVLFGWRMRLRRQVRWPSVPYLILGLLFVAVLVVQGTLGGNKVFSGM